MDLDRPDKRHYRRILHCSVAGTRTTYGKIECNFCSWLVHLSEEAGLFVCDELVGEGGGGDEGEQVGNEAQQG